MNEKYLIFILILTKFVLGNTKAFAGRNQLAYYKDLDNILSDKVNAQRFTNVVFYESWSKTMPGRIIAAFFQASNAQTDDAAVQGTTTLSNLRYKPICNIVDSTITLTGNADINNIIIMYSECH